MGQRHSEEQMGAPRSVPTSPEDGRLEGRRVTNPVYPSARLRTRLFYEDEPFTRIYLESLGIEF
jgi:hypothetical protein